MKLLIHLLMVSKNLIKLIHIFRINMCSSIKNFITGLCNNKSNNKTILKY